MMKVSDGELHEVKRCPHCGVANPRLGRLWMSAPLARADGGKQHRWAVFGCATCGHAVLAKGAHSPQGAENTDVVALFPEPRSAHGDIPDTARTYLQQAYETMHAPDAAGLMAASSVDAMLKNLGYADGSLYSRIDKAVEDGVLTKGMADWAHSVRLEANKPRHADVKSPHLTAAEARQSVEFAEALGHFSSC